MSDTPDDGPAETAFRCTSCAVKLVVYKSCVPATGLMVRFRKCPKCDRRVKTREEFEKVINPGGGCPPAPETGGDTGLSLTPPGVG